MSPSFANHCRNDVRHGHVIRPVAALLFGLFVLTSGDIANAAPIRPTPQGPTLRPTICNASWYGGPHVGRTTASGEVHSLFLRTAAHRTLPFGTVIRVTNLRNGKTSVVRINDRGPFVSGRAIDLSEQAARDLAMTNEGVARVKLEVIAHHGRP
ncbi:septal ring lytic transglycosylase RlpA family protein [Telmatospirillum sp.]|uniref:septal ring lytic transglycosylase RlpA family protein n=1 Tax=Telmatospirillum sp. TaxID=2079197 RepID=UPI00284770D7|nr:septal ring lytic transglycosylase RlpA family protein [Telmatospirillum sp.]MDR3441117.1 septal ring lytic transglycosylase RlpA family protein [Telmatospirillum sp.]